jgi:DNA helicase-2/ATP-dependent DNA helicase PcrA
MVRRGGRICAVGDERQAIYGFRGADADAIPGLIRTLGAKTLPLSITYRCARSIVELARREVPELEEAPNAPEGVISNERSEIMLDKAAAGDMIISRLNAPLVSLCLGLFARGKRAAIMGRNIGEGLIRLIDKSKATEIEKLEEWVRVWSKREAARLVKKGRTPEEAEDKLACIEALCEGAESVSEVRQRAEVLFSDKEGATKKITLGTTHKLKGLEADKVWMLTDTYRRERGGEEANLWYVAVTRAKTELVLTTSPARKTKTRTTSEIADVVLA